jgi:aspartyl-tRNA(Asn)/glutamyl-tRNA(Gln) amidotransferase subunit C
MLTIEELEYIADVARLSLTDEEKEEMTKSINEMITYFDKLNNMETSNVEPMELITTESNVLREDIVVESYDREIILANASEHRNGYFSVPQIVE